jgi:molybdate transport system substrate-binding protein
MWKTVIVSVAALALGFPVAEGWAAELVIFSTGSMSEPVKEIGEAFTHATGHKLSYVIGTTGALQRRLRAGEHSDVIAISAEGAEPLAQEGRYSGARSDFARSVIAIAVKAGTHLPDISTPDAFKQAMVNAKSISISDPALGSISGVYLLSLFEKMGIAEDMKRKTVIKPVGTEVATAVAQGEAEIGVTFRSELTPNKGVTVAETFPTAIQSPTLYVIGVASTTKVQDAARAFVAFALTPDSQAKLKELGVEPAARPR